MEINFIEKDGLTVAVIDDFYSKADLEEMNNELIFLNNPTVFKLFCNHVVAVKDGVVQQKSQSLFLDDFFNQNRDASTILSKNRLIFNKDLASELSKKHAFFGHLSKCNKDTTLINFYAPNDYYAPHHDTSMLSVLTFLNFEEVDGGEFCFPDYDVVVKPILNRVVIFPGCVNHGSSVVTNGTKVSMAQFLNYGVL